MRRFYKMRLLLTTHLAATILGFSSANLPSRLKVTMKSRTILGLASMIAAIVCGCSNSDQGEWKPAGDGRTIVNSKTGELRDVKTGLTVKELTAKREAAEDEAQKKDLANEAQRQASLAQARVAEQRRLENNDRISARIKPFVERQLQRPGATGTNTYAEYKRNHDWEKATKPLRTNSRLTDRDVIELLDMLKTAAKTEPFKSDASLREVIDELMRWEYESATPK